MSADQSTGSLPRRYALVLLLLAGLFAFRVVAQLVQVWYLLEFLPPFETWHSGAVPYCWLVGTQVVILAMCIRIVWQLFHNQVISSPEKGRLLCLLGCIYFSVMSIRLFLGRTVASEYRWFGATLPTVFHLVLASFVILYGRFHSLAAQAMCATPKGTSA